MAGNAYAVAEQADGLMSNAGPSEDNRWEEFWYSLRQYLHKDWIDNASPKWLSQDSSALAWNTGYRELCSYYGLPESIEEPEVSDWKLILTQVVAQPTRAVSIAGKAALAAKDSASTVRNRKSDPLSLEDQRLAAQLGNALSLDRRFSIPGSIQQRDEVGAWFLYLALMTDYPPGWRRMRLALDYGLVEKLQACGEPECAEAANQRALRRLWRTIASKAALT